MRYSADASGCRVVNAASAASGIIAPSEIVSIFGDSIGPAAGVTGQYDATGRLPSTLGGVKVFFNDTAAPIYYAGPNQINAQAPLALARDSIVKIRVQFGGITSDAWSTLVTTAAPGIFGAISPNGRVAAALNADGSVNSADHPATRGSIVSLFATGGGLTTPAIADGVLAELISTHKSSMRAPLPLLLV
jgi:uncharacterized protein (TIGR03437 family)